MSRLLEFDSYTGIREILHKDKTSGKLTVQKSQITDGLIDANLKEASTKQAGWRGDMHKVASIPLIIAEKWREELKARGEPDTNPFSRANKKFLIAKINSSEFVKLRTKHGNI